MYLRRIAIAIVLLLIVWYVMWMTPLGFPFFEFIRDPFISIAQIGRRGQQFLLRESYTDGVDVMILSSTIDVLEEENAQLRSLLSFSERSVFRGIGGQVLARTFDPISEELVLDRGSVDGVALLNPVVASDGVLIGVISHVEAHRSVARLLIDPGSRVAGRLLNTDQTEGVVIGGHGIVVRMELIPRDEHVSEGMVLVTSGLDEFIPRGLVIGEVVAIEQDANSLFLRAIIAPPVDYDRLTHVLIGTSL